MKTWVAKLKTSLKNINSNINARKDGKIEGNLVSRHLADSDCDFSFKLSCALFESFPMSWGLEEASLNKMENV